MKRSIIRYVKEHKKDLAKSFTPAQNQVYLDKALIDKNWVRTGKYPPLSYDYEVVHEFDCRPYKEKLKAYIYTSKDICEINNVIVQTEG